MALDATVRCRCWEDDLVSQPPVPRDLIYVDDEDFLDARLPDGDERYGQFWCWKQHACSHPNFHFAFERIGNAATLGAFLDAVDRAGADQFPALTAELGSGTTGSDQAAVCLQELEFFIHRADLGTATTLFDDESGAILRRCASGNAWFAAANPWRIGLDDDGFFVRQLVDAPMPAHQTPARSQRGPTKPSRSAAPTARDAEVFRSNLFTQKVLRPPRGGDPIIDAWVVKAERRRLVEVRLAALDRSSQITLALREPIEAPLTTMPDGKVGWNGRDYPRRLRVQAAPTPAAAFAAVTDALATVFRASVETRNPVYWF